MGRRSVALHCDLTDERCRQPVVNRVRESLGTPVCLVNNASVFEHDSVTDFSADALDFHMRTNLTAPVLLSRALYAMTPEGSQSVAINLLDQKLDNLNPSFLSYTLSKAALNTATTLLAQELAPKLRVVGIAPALHLFQANRRNRTLKLPTKIHLLAVPAHRKISPRPSVLSPIPRHNRNHHRRRWRTTFNSPLAGCHVCR